MGIKEKGKLSAREKDRERKDAIGKKRREWVREREIERDREREREYSPAVYGLVSSWWHSRVARVSGVEVMEAEEKVDGVVGRWVSGRG